jgi:hypothetical protein
MNRFIPKIEALLTRLGAEHDKDKFTLQTKVGPLTLYPTENTTEGPGTVFGRFDDPDKAKQLVDCNPYSGKWNHHYFNPWTVDTAVNDLAYQLEKVL